MNIFQTKYQIASAIQSCEGRIGTGADITQAFKWLYEEVDKILNGAALYDSDSSRVLDILNRKAKGIDCTEEESVTSALWLETMVATA